MPLKMTLLEAPSALAFACLLACACNIILCLPQGQAPAAASSCQPQRAAGRWTRPFMGKEGLQAGEQTALTAFCISVPHRALLAATLQSSGPGRRMHALSSVGAAGVALPAPAGRREAPALRHQGWARCGTEAGCPHGQCRCRAGSCTCPPSAPGLWGWLAGRRAGGQSDGGKGGRAGQSWQAGEMAALLPAAAACATGMAIDTEAEGPRIACCASNHVL